MASRAVQYQSHCHRSTHCSESDSPSTLEESATSNQQHNNTPVVCCWLGVVDNRLLAIYLARACLASYYSWVLSCAIIHKKQHKKIKTYWYKLLYFRIATHYLAIWELRRCLASHCNVCMYVYGFGPAMMNWNTQNNFKIFHCTRLVSVTERRKKSAVIAIILNVNVTKGSKLVTLNFPLLDIVM